jgi:hypothetical protein
VPLLILKAYCVHMMGTVVNWSNRLELRLYTFLRDAHICVNLLELMKQSNVECKRSGRIGC